MGGFLSHANRGRGMLPFIHRCLGLNLASCALGRAPAESQTRWVPGRSGQAGDSADRERSYLGVLVTCPRGFGKSRSRRERPFTALDLPCQCTEIPEVRAAVFGAGDGVGVGVAC